MSTTLSSFDSQHQDMIHDAQMDYYGKRLATCSSDKTIKIFNVSKDSQKHARDLVSHEGPVWQICWAHPKFGSKLASCSYDRKVIVWSEDHGQWSKYFEYSGHQLSVNSISWAPHEFGLALVCGSSDGTVSVLTHKGVNDWSTVRFKAHETGVNSVCWAPATVPSSLLNEPNSASAGKNAPTGRFCSGGCDNMVKIWQLNSESGEWIIESALEGHSDWVRDVAWAPDAGLPYSTIASCSQDGTVVIWTQTDSNSLVWSKREIESFSSPVWRVSWSVTANILAVSCGDNTVTLWKESIDQGWNKISTLHDNENTNDQNGAL